MNPAPEVQFSGDALFYADMHIYYIWYRIIESVFKLCHYSSVVCDNGYLSSLAKALSTLEDRIQLKY